MGLTILAPLFGVLVLVFAYAQYLKRQTSVRQLSSQQTLANCHSLIMLLRLLQQHRGLSCAWLAGDKGDMDFQTRLSDCGRKIQKALVPMNDLIHSESIQDTPCATVNDWALFKHHWKNLLEILPTLSVEQNIARHSQLLRKILGWLAAIGESRIEPWAFTHDCRGGPMVGVTRNFAHRLPQLSECLGQIRAIGCSVAAQQRCSQVARVRLLFLVARAEMLLDQAVAAHDSASVSLISTQKSVKEMAATVRTRMLFSGVVVVRAEEFFAISTKAIDLVFEWIQACQDDTLHCMLGTVAEGLGSC